MNTASISAVEKVDQNRDKDKNLSPIFSTITPAALQEEMAGMGRPEGLSNVFFPNANNQPPQPPPVAEADGVQILTHQNISSIIAAQGMGKTSLLEAFIASFINPNCDTLGLKVNPEVGGLIAVDFERTNIDVWNTYQRIKRRAQVSSGIDYLPGVNLAGMRAIPRVASRKEIILHLLDTNPCGLLILDGSGDMVNDVNNLDEAIECRVWMRELTVKYGCSILTTLHPNPGSVKPRGHQGSELIRECEAVLLARKQEGDVRMLTTDFEHGKNRNGAEVTIGYQWSDESKMFVSCDLEEFRVNKSAAAALRKRNDLEVMFKKIMPLTGVRRNALDKLVADELGKTVATGKRKVNDAIQEGIIIKGQDEYYRLKV